MTIYSHLLIDSKQRDQFFSPEWRHSFRRSQSDLRKSVQRRWRHSCRLFLLLLHRTNHVRRLRHLRSLQVTFILESFHKDEKLPFFVTFSKSSVKKTMQRYSTKRIHSPQKRLKLNQRCFDYLEIDEFV